MPAHKLQKTRTKRISLVTYPEFPLTGSEISYFMGNVVNMFVAQKQGQLAEFFNWNPEMQSILEKLREAGF